MNSGYEIRTIQDWSLRAEENLRIIAREPHKLGWLMGFDKLTALHSQWILYVWESNEPRALQAFRGGYKTTAIVLVGTVRWMLFHPDDRILLTRKAFKDTAEIVRAISRAMGIREIQELFKQAHGRYPQAKVDREGSLTYNFKRTNTPEGNVTGMGIDQGLTGRHYDKIINDDIITLKDRVSRAEREHTAEMVREIAANIIDPGKGSIWTGTPWHRDDAWKTINKFCDIAKYPLSKYNFLGEKETDRKRQSTTPYLYAANYELELLSDESLLFTDPVYAKDWDFLQTGTVAHLDAAFGGADFCALSIASPLRQAGRHIYYQIVGFTHKGNVKQWIPEIARLCKKYRARHIYLETNPDQGYTADKLSDAGMRTKTYFERQNKHIKISTYLFDAWRFLEWAPETDDEYMSQVLDYREGSEPDDAPDSAASLFREAFPNKRINLARWEL